MAGRAFAFALLSSSVSYAAETVLGVYMFHRHGDRTAKSTPPANLTNLGYSEVYHSGQYYRNRYVAPDAPLKIAGLNSDIVLQSQIAVSAPSDTVLQNSAQGFLQALYPAVGPQLGNEPLANGSSVESPLNGSQLIPISLVSSGSGSEDNGWLQSSTGCGNSVISSNNYFTSPDYQNLLKSTSGFYQNLTPVINGSFSPSTTSYKNAYTIYDLINVAEIHNASIHTFSNLLTPATLLQLRTLADQHEFNLAYNASETARALAGATLAAQAVQYLNNTIVANHNYSGPRLGIQFGAYNSFQSFFGLANLTSASPDFYGIPDYASVMLFELYTNASLPATGGLPPSDELYVRFLFNNGTSAPSTTPLIYPLFGGTALDLRWDDFVSGMNQFAVGTTQQWCQVCGNTTGACAPFASPAGSASSAGGETGSGNGISTAVGGVIGAMVTLAVILGAEALILLVFGLRVVSKRRLASSPARSDLPVSGTKS